MSVTPSAVRSESPSVLPPEFPRSPQLPPRQQAPLTASPARPLARTGLQHRRGRPACLLFRWLRPHSRAACSVSELRRERSARAGVGGTGPCSCAVGLVQIRLLRMSMDGSLCDRVPSLPGVPMGVHWPDPTVSGFGFLGAAQRPPRRVGSWLAPRPHRVCASFRLQALEGRVGISVWFSSHG